VNQVAEWNGWTDDGNDGDGLDEIKAGTVSSEIWALPLITGANMYKAITRITSSLGKNQRPRLGPYRR